MNFDYNVTETSATEATSIIAAMMAFMGTFLLVIVAILIVLVVAQWKLFEKAGKPGWAALIPIYSSYVLFQIVDMPGWLAFIILIPGVNFAFTIIQYIAYYKLALKFGKSSGFAILSIFFPFVTLPMMAFGSATYQGAPTAPMGATQGVAPGMDPMAAQQAPYAPQPAVMPVPVAPVAPAPMPATPQAPVIEPSVPAAPMAPGIDPMIAQPAVMPMPAAPVAPAPAGVDKFCPSCGTKLTGDATSCFMCGSQL